MGRCRCSPPLTSPSSSDRTRQFDSHLDLTLQVTLSREGELLQWKFRKAQCGDSARVIVTNLPSKASWQDLKDFMRTVSLAPSVVYADVSIPTSLLGKDTRTILIAQLIVYCIHRYNRASASAILLRHQQQGGRSWRRTELCIATPVTRAAVMSGCSQTNPWTCCFAKSRDECRQAGR